MTKAEINAWLDRFAQFWNERTHKSSCEFYQRLVEAAELHAKKQRDYGTGEDPFANVRATEKFGIPAWVGVAIRMNDKITRIQSMVKKGSLANESVEDSLLDIGVYAIIALVLRQQDAEKQRLLDECKGGEAPAKTAQVSLRDALEKFKMASIKCDESDFGTLVQ